MAQHLVANFQSQWQVAVYAIAISLCATCKNQLTPSAQFVPLFVQETAEKQPLSISCWCCAARQARTCISCCFLFTTCLSPLFSWKKKFIQSKKCFLFSAYCSPQAATLKGNFAFLLSPKILRSHPISELTLTP